MFLGIIIGIVGIVVILPIVDMIMEILGLVFKIISNKLSVTILKQNNIIMDLQNELESQDTHAIGFQVSSEDYYDEEDNCGEDNLIHKNKKIGF